MKIVKFLGGLGNQMFQYAFMVSLQQHFGKVKADLTGFNDYELHQGFELDKVFGICLEEATDFDLRIYTPERRDWMTRKLRRLYGTKNAWYNEKAEFVFDSSIYEDPKPRYFWGYWQHHLYHKGITDQLRNKFVFKAALEGENLTLSQRILKTNSVSIHVRRGDYVDHPILGGICDPVYYQHAIAAIKKKLKDPFFVVFSNDMNWCHIHLDLPGAVFVDWNPGEQSYRDMQLMGLCKHHIIANSSFSWWGAWLNPAKEKLVISPQRWVNIPGADPAALISPNWITL